MKKRERWLKELTSRQRRRKLKVYDEVLKKDRTRKQWKRNRKGI
jgi:hypothetical protein